MLVLDQHAAHESVLYEQLMSAEPNSLELAEAFSVHLSGGQAHAITRLQPVLATIMAVVALGERVTLPLVAGGAVIFSGVYLTERG